MSVESVIGKRSSAELVPLETSAKFSRIESVSAPILRTEIVDKTEYVRHRPLFSIWGDVASAKFNLAMERRKPKEAARFMNSKTLLSILCQPAIKDRLQTVFVRCMDEQRQTVGFMLRSTPSQDTDGRWSVVIYYLVSAPQHLASRFNPNRVHGIGRTLLQEAENAVVEKGGGDIELESLPSSRFFYERCGFVLEDESCGDADTPHLSMIKRVAPLAQKTLADRPAA